ncbi:MAG: uridine kinase [Actinomycetota bacterium]|nr:uridine kinase [Actinomycetota bacterium]MDQ3707965.1 uridine kinase [Actinomycetota bacterium]
MRGVRTFADLAAQIHALPPRLGDVRLITVDGPSGAGKSTFAGHLVTALEHRGSVALVGIEALYRGWTLDGSWQRLDEAVLEPLAAGWAGGFHPYDWVTQSWSSRWCVVPVSQVLVVEGCGSSPRAADRLTSYRVWVEAAPEVAFERGRSRQGVDLDRRLRDWQRLQAAHFAAQDTRGRADLRVNGAPTVPLPYDPAAAFSTLC